MPPDTSQQSQMMSQALTPPVNMIDDSGHLPTQMDPAQGQLVSPQADSPAEAGLGGMQPSIGAPAAPVAPGHVSVARHIVDALSATSPGDKMSWAKGILAGGLAGAANAGGGGTGWLTGAGNAAKAQQQQALQQKQQAFENKQKQEAADRAKQQLENETADSQTRRAYLGAQTLTETQKRNFDAERQPHLLKSDDLNERKLGQELQKGENDLNQVDVQTHAAFLASGGTDEQWRAASATTMNEANGHPTLISGLTGKDGLVVHNQESHTDGHDDAGVVHITDEQRNKIVPNPTDPDWKGYIHGYTFDKKGDLQPQYVKPSTGVSLNDVAAYGAAAKQQRMQMLDDQKQKFDLQVKQDTHQEAMASIDQKRAEIQKTLSEAGLGGLKPADPVIGFDSKGNQILTSAGDAKTLGLSNVNKADTALVEKASIARSYIPLNNELLKDIDELEKADKLGVLATRWNEFLAGKVGSGDPLFEKFRVDSGLANTQLMQFHVGNRGGAYMLEHFQDLANQKKLDAATLRAGVKEEGVYAAHRAMMPGELAKKLTGTALTEPTPGTHVFDSQAWSSANPGKDVNAAIAQAKQQGYEVKQ
jgi:hypothetical protein